MSARAWLKAARLPAQSNIAIPILVGLALGRSGSTSWSATNAALAFAFGLFIQLSIVFTNDAFDVETDRHNATFTPFSGGSRVLVDGLLSRGAVARAAAASALTAIAVSVALGARTGSLLPPSLALAGVLLSWAYSAPPLSLAYRGGGELLQVAGTAIVLPLFGFAAQRGSLAAFPWLVLASLVPIRLACAIATALPDEPSDRAARKRTLVVLLGVGPAAWLMALGAALSLTVAARSWRGPGVTLLAVPAAFACVALALRHAQPGSQRMLARVAAAIAATLSFELVLAYGALAR